MLNVFHTIITFAQAGQKSSENCAAMGLSQIVMILALFAIFYFLLIRPQQKKAKEHQEMLKSLKKGDRVITSGGLIGTVVGVAEKFMTIEISEKVRVKVLRANIIGKDTDTENVDKGK